MPVWIRRTALALTGLVLGVTAAAWWLASVFDPAPHQSAAIDWVKARHDRTLAIDGPVRLSLFPRVEVRLSGLTLSEAGSAQPFAAVDELALGVEWLPLLRRRMVVDRIDARGVRVVLLGDAKGRRNFDDLLRPTTPPAPTSPTQTNGAARDATPTFDLHRIRLSTVQARVKDEAAGIDGELVLKELSTGRIESQRESALHLVAQFGFKAPALKGELSGSTRFTPDFGTGSLRLSGMSLAYKGDAPGASSIDALLKGALAWDGARSSLSASGLNLRVSANAAGLRLVGSTLAVDHFALDAARRAFAIGQLQLRVKGSQGGSLLALDLDWPELDVSGDSLRGSALAGKLTYGNALPLAVTFKSDAPSGNFDNVRVPAFEARLTSSAAARRIVGGLRSELVLQPQKRTALLDKIDLQLRLDEPGLKPLTLALTGMATATAATGGNTRWNLLGDVNANAFSTEGTASLAGITPNVKAQVRFNLLDLNAMLAPPAAGATDSAPIDLAPLRSVNGSLGVRVGSLALRQYRATDVALDATLDAGMLRVSHFRGRAWGGVVDGSFFADARASRLALKAGADGVDLNAVLKDVAAKELIDGTGRIELDIESAGRTQAELKSRLKGSATLLARDGALRGTNLARAVRPAKPPLSLNLNQDTLIRANRTDRTEFQELAASFRIDAGFARATDLALKSPALRAVGDAAVDIVKGRLDARLKTSFTDAPRSQDGAELTALRGTTLPVQINGPLDAVQWRLEWSAAVAGAARAPAAPPARADAERRPRDRPPQRVEPRPTAAAPTAAAPA
ncbi:MAG: hypothetical protein AD742_14765, partial [Methylibium sp. NZG]